MTGASDAGEATPERLLTGLWRLRAPNAGAMTGPGTNTFLLGEPIAAVVDPGPLAESHYAALLAAAPRLRYVFVTHTHGDHSPLARRLAEATSAELIGRPPPDDGRQDLSTRSAREPRDRERFDLGRFSLTAHYTPGHASNHVCYLLEPANVLLSGDHVLDGVTPVILAPDGDLSDYLASLRRLLALPLTAIAPGHGELIGKPREVIEGVIAHRLKREQKIRTVLQRTGGGDLAQLVAPIYDDVPTKMHGWARHTLEAHLIKLERDGECFREGNQWRYRGPPS